MQAGSAVRAAAWCEYLAAHARRIYGCLDAARVTQARTLARNIARGKLPDHFTAHDVRRKGWSQLKTAQEVEAALSVLEEHGYLRSYEAAEGLGRPTVRHVVNPQLWAQS